MPHTGSSAVLDTACNSKQIHPCPHLADSQVEERWWTEYVNKLERKSVSGLQGNKSKVRWSQWLEGAGSIINQGRPCGEVTLNRLGRGANVWERSLKQEEAMVSMKCQKGSMSILVHFRNNREARGGWSLVGQEGSGKRWVWPEATEECQFPLFIYWDEFSLS